MIGREREVGGTLGCLVIVALILIGAGTVIAWVWRLGVWIAQALR